MGYETIVENKEKSNKKKGIKKWTQMGICSIDGKIKRIKKIKQEEKMKK